LYNFSASAIVQRDGSAFAGRTYGARFTDIGDSKGDRTLGATKLTGAGGTG
jgi:hypothetical protein